MTDISSVINVVVNVGDIRVSSQGFGVPLIFDVIESTVFPERVRAYTSLTTVSADFSTLTKVYKMAQAIFAQPRSPSIVKVGRRAAADASNNAALDAIVIEDNDWYCLLTPKKLKSELNGLALHLESLKKIFLCSSEDSEVHETATDDVASLLKAGGYERSAYLWHYQAGVDVTGASYAVVNGVATIVEASHGLNIGDPIVFVGSTGESSDGIDGDNTIATVATDGNSFTVLTDAIDTTGSETVNYFARYTFPEAAWAGRQLSSTPGSETWKFNQLSGVNPSPGSILTPAGELRALAKNANLYTTLGGVGHTHEGVMASGRFIDVQRGIDWLEARLGEAIANRLLNAQKIPYTDAGGTILQAEIASVLDRGITNGLLGPLLDNSGRFYNIHIPKVADQLQADRSARHFPGITVQAQLAGAVHSLNITVNALI